MDKPGGGENLDIGKFSCDILFCQQGEEGGDWWKGKKEEEEWIGGSNDNRKRK